MTPDTLERDLWRCVDGELSQTEEQALLQRLDESEAGWRSLALTFLEQRLWRDVCRADESKLPSGQPTTRTTVKAERPRTRSFGMSVTHAALAASLLAGTLGFFLGRQTDANRDTSQPQVASIDTRPTLIVTHAATPADAIGTTPIDPGGVSPVEDLFVRPQLNVQFVGQNGQSETVPVPLYSEDEWDQWSPLLEASRLPAEVRAALQEAGYQVEEVTELVTVPLDESYQVAFPVSRLRVQPGAL